ncbi:ABC transporter permease [Isoptericola sp. b441]|uniref:ABC transporter permease n=1 Tax=Actinotalea lenta TaxID=3064654 RepID=A0ABT9D7H3_9CELL|nr:MULTISPECIES: ABC transporter permease [unclassified Isoptericola]MDO8106386.1 ABC transporter permease [Isoptericola sp. b441]MDO8121895.1 ABC transporter permease [Isoptericola sp. b490]
MTTLTRTARLLRLALRRDRILLPTWIVAISGIAWATVESYTAMMSDAAQRLATATYAAGNPIARLMDGPAAGTDLGAMSMVESYQVLAILTALMSGQAVVRHTRQDEETGRAELIGSAVVGRHARLSAALLITLGANVVLGLAVAAALVASDLGTTGALAAGLSVAGLGWVFAGVAAVASQVFGTARAANAAVGAALGVAFLLRAVGDLLGHVADSGVQVISAWPSWLSPIGWGQQLRPFQEDNWWIAGLFGGLTLVLASVAYVLADHRDVGAGMVTPRPGPAHAAPGLGTDLGLAWRLQRGTLLTWLGGLVALTAVFASVADSAEDLVAENDQLAEILGRLAPQGTVVDLYFTLTMAIIGIAAAGYTVQVLLRMRAEETTGRLEPVLATAVDRYAWMTRHVTIAFGGTAVILALSGLAGGVVYGAMTGRWAVGVGGLVAAALANAAAALALGGFVVATFGLIPRWAGALAWSALAGSLVVGQLGALLELPQAVLNLSPFTHVPAIPADAFELTPVLVLLGVAGGLTAVGMLAFRHRDAGVVA